MQIKQTEYQGKILRYVHQPGGRVKFNTDNFFDILGVDLGEYVGAGERDFIDYEIAQPIAFRIDEEFAAWLAEQFQDYEIGAMIDGN